MSTSGASARPAQVTFAGWSVAIASALLLLSTFEALGGLQTVEVREALAKRIDSGNLQGLGLSLSDAITATRWALYVAGVAAVVTGVFGIFVLQRDKVARIGLSAAAVPIVLTVPLTGSFLAMLIGAGAVVLWSGPARDWFAGRPIRQREPRSTERRDDTPTDAPAPPAPVPWVPPTTESPYGAPAQPAQPAPTHGWGGAPGDAPDPVQHPAAWQPYQAPPGYAGYQQTPVAPTRPRQVRNACLVTWIFTGVTALVYLGMLVVVAVDQQALIDLVTENPAWDPSYDEDLIVTAAVVGSVAFLIWCVAVSVIAVFTWRGAQWAWITHLVSAGMAGLVSLVALPVSLVHLAAIGAVVGLLLSRTSRTWFTTRRP